jgi:hypothetical protein
MSKFKHAALALVAASLMAVQAQATEVQAQSPQAVPVATFSQADINTMFEQAGKPMQLAALSGQEMKETEGSWFWLYFYGPQIATATTWMANTGWRAIPGWYHSFRQRW